MNHTILKDNYALTFWMFAPYNNFSYFMSNYQFKQCELKNNGKCTCSNSWKLWTWVEGLSSLPPCQNLWSGLSSLLLFHHSFLVLALLFFMIIKQSLFFDSQFRESGCENCPFLQMEEDHERAVECTTPNFNGYVWHMFLHQNPNHLWNFLLSFFFVQFDFQDHFSNGSNSKLGCPLAAYWYIHLSSVTHLL